MRITLGDPVAQNANDQLIVEEEEFLCESHFVTRFSEAINDREDEEFCRIALVILFVENKGDQRDREDEEFLLIAPADPILSKRRRSTDRGR